MFQLFFGENLHKTQTYLVLIQPHSGGELKYELSPSTKSDFD